VLQDGFILFNKKEALMRSAKSTSLSLSRISAATLIAVALLSACGKKDDAKPALPPAPRCRRRKSA
jgi:hypothetical protein